MWGWVVAAVIAIVAYVYTPRPKTQTRKPAGINEIEVPTAERGREIAVVFGTVDIKSPNVVWYGDLRVEPIRK
ncbi:MAG: hypothetical protein Unbinned4162contig1001_72 [Prokaryotic dsDNA virus sp.]|nr:MAG: hypothetical protein Unbinned4162contig1001_72 [Prokaryotic dsDNA virus sp.]